MSSVASKHLYLFFNFSLPGWHCVCMMESLQTENQDNGWAFIGPGSLIFCFFFLKNKKKSSPTLKIHKYFVCEKVVNDYLIISHISTLNQAEYLLTRFTTLWSNTGVVDGSIILRGIIKNHTLVSNYWTNYIICSQFHPFIN